MICIVTDDPNLVQSFSPINAVQIQSVQDLPSNAELKALIFDERLNVKESDIFQVRKAFPFTFLSIYDPTATTKPQFRLVAFDLGVNQVGYDVTTIIDTITEDVIYRDRNSRSSYGQYSCPYCGLNNLSEDDLWRHFPAFHINSLPKKNNEYCPICNKDLNNGKPLQVLII